MKQVWVLILVFLIVAVAGALTVDVVMDKHDAMVERVIQEKYSTPSWGDDVSPEWVQPQGPQAEYQQLF